MNFNRYIWMYLFLILSNLCYGDSLPNSTPLIETGDLAAKMVAGIDHYLMDEIETTKSTRTQYWNRDFSSHENYTRSIEDNRQYLQNIIGLEDSRLPVEVTFNSSLHSNDNSLQNAIPIYLDSSKLTIRPIRWSVLSGVYGEGLLLEPKSPALANAVVLPDCDVPPEEAVGLGDLPLSMQMARRLAENGCRVIVPTLINRRADFSGIPDVRMTNLPHREYLYRASYEMGRHIIGYEVQKVLACTDWFKSEFPDMPVAVAGSGEGGLIAFYSAAVDPRIDATLVSGYFQPRESMWSQPIYREVWSYLHEFGDAELASLIAPRPLIIEHGWYPAVSGPPQIAGRNGGSPGVLESPMFRDVQQEVQRARELTKGLKPPFKIELVKSEDDEVGCRDSVTALLKSLELNDEYHEITQLNHTVPSPPDRMKRQFNQILEHTQTLMRESEFTRAKFWENANATSVETWQESTQWYRDYFHDKIIGRLPELTMLPNCRSRLIYDQPTYLGYEVMLDVYPDIFAYGILLLPKDIQPGERRPVVVCQHGLEGRPTDVADPGLDHSAYHQFGCKLAEQGFVVFAPQNPYIGEDDFRVLLRKSRPLKLTLFSFIVRQHEQILRWLSQQPFADPQRIAFYGLSYGGKTAMRVPALLDGYCLSICSADYNEWIWKNVSSHHKYSYLLTVEHDMIEFDLGNTFNYAELSWLILPRPFMVERGHYDGVAPDEWVAYEFAKTRRQYDRLGLFDSSAIEFFNGPHTINGVGTFEFLHKHLNWPAKN